MEDFRDSGVCQCNSRSRSRIFKPPPPPLRVKSGVVVSYFTCDELLFISRLGGLSYVLRVSLVWFFVFLRGVGSHKRYTQVNILNTF